MDAEVKDFIENATLLFIVTRNGEGTPDVSPRGGQPCVLRVNDRGVLLLPDYSGNRRLDTIGNLLADPRVTLIVLNRNSERYLRIVASGKVSFDDDFIAAFPADENPPVSVLAITPESFEFVHSNAFSRSGLWSYSKARKPPLDLGAVVRADKLAQASAGFAPVLKREAEERLLAESGVRGIYGVASEGVQTKVSDIAGPGGIAFMEEARFIIVAHETAPGTIAVDLAAEAPLSVIPFDNRQAFRLHMPAEVETADEGECALLTIAPSRSEIMRVNGRFEKESAHDGNSLKIVPEEVFFHCPAALNRSRIWQEDRRIAWNGRRRFTCRETRRESPDVVSFVLSPRDKAPIGPIGPGQYVTLSLPHDPEVPLRQRSYSVSGRPDDSSLRISVRRIGNGGVSDLLHDTVEAGTEVHLGIPAGRFLLESPPGRRVALISAGVGITPLLPMLERLAKEDGEREVWFIHAARDGGHHLFREEARRLANGKANLRLLSAYSRPRENDVCDLGRRLDAAALASLLPVTDTDFYVCGPSAFMEGLKEGLVALGAEPASIRFEAFSVCEVLDWAGMDVAAECEVAFARSGKTVRWTPSCGSLLDLALKNGVKAAYSCRQGDCLSCLQRLLGGTADYPMGELPVLADDQVLLCQAIPREDMVIDC